MQLTVLTDRSQGGSSLKAGSLELMVRGEPHPSWVLPGTHPDPAKLEGCGWYLFSACGLGPTLFPLPPFLVLGLRRACITMPGLGIMFLSSTFPLRQSLFWP